MLKVSVLIPTYNRAVYLREAIASALAQEGVDLEVVVSDNASTDETAAVVREFADPRLRYSRNETNLGTHGNFKRVFALSRGGYVCFLCDDDLMLPGNLAPKVKLLDTHPQVGMVHSNMLGMDGTGQPVDYPWVKDHQADFIAPGLDYFRVMMRGRNPVCLPAAVVRRECLEKLSWAESNLNFTSDFKLWMRIALHYDVAYLAAPLVKYRLHGGQDSAQFKNLGGVREDFLVKKIMARAAAKLMGDGRQLLRAAAKLHGRDAVNVGCRYYGEGRWAEARECALFALRIHPQFLADWTVVRFACRTVLGAAGEKYVVHVKQTLRKALGRG